MNDTGMITIMRLQRKYRISKNFKTLSNKEFCINLCFSIYTKLQITAILTFVKQISSRYVCKKSIDFHLVFKS